MYIVWNQALENLGNIIEKALSLTIITWVPVCAHQFSHSASGQVGDFAGSRRDE